MNRTKLTFASFSSTMKSRGKTDDDIAVMAKKYREKFGLFADDAEPAPEIPATPPAGTMAAGQGPEPMPVGQQIGRGVGQPMSARRSPIPSAPAQAAPAPQPQEQGYFNQEAENYRQLGERAQDRFASIDQPTIAGDWMKSLGENKEVQNMASVPEGLLRGAGAIVGTAIDVPLTAVGSAVHAIPHMIMSPEGRQEMKREGGSFAKGVLGPISNPVIDAATGAAGAYQKFAEKNPAVSSDINAVTNLGMAFVPVEKVAGRALGLIGDLAKLPERLIAKTGKGLERVGELTGKPVEMEGIPQTRAQSASPVGVTKPSVGFWSHFEPFLRSFMGSSGEFARMGKIQFDAAVKRLTEIFGDDIGNIDENGYAQKVVNQIQERVKGQKAAFGALYDDALKNGKVAYVDGENAAISMSKRLANDPKFTSLPDADKNLVNGYIQKLHDIKSNITVQPSPIPVAPPEPVPVLPDGYTHPWHVETYPTVVPPQGNTNVGSNFEQFKILMTDIGGSMRAAENALKMGTSANPSQSARLLNVLGGIKAGMKRLEYRHLEMLGGTPLAEAQKAIDRAYADEIGDMNFLKRLTGLGSGITDKGYKTADQAVDKLLSTKDSRSLDVALKWMDDQSKNSLGKALLANILSKSTKRGLEEPVGFLGTGGKKKFDSILLETLDKEVSKNKEILGKICGPEKVNELERFILAARKARLQHIGVQNEWNPSGTGMVGAALLGLIEAGSNTAKAIAQVAGGSVLGSIATRQPLAIVRALSEHPVLSSFAAAGAIGGTANAAMSPDQSLLGRAGAFGRGAIGGMGAYGALRAAGGAAELAGRAIPVGRVGMAAERTGMAQGGQAALEAPSGAPVALRSIGEAQNAPQTALNEAQRYDLEQALLKGRQIDRFERSAARVGLVGAGAGGAYGGWKGYEAAGDTPQEKAVGTVTGILTGMSIGTVAALGSTKAGREMLNNASRGSTLRGMYTFPLWEQATRKLEKIDPDVIDKAAKLYQEFEGFKSIFPKTTTDELTGRKGEPLVGNVDYYKSLDLDQTCPRNATFDAVKRVAEVKLGRPLVRAESNMILDRLISEQVKTICPACYVQSQRAIYSESLFKLSKAYKIDPAVWVDKAARDRFLAKNEGGLKTLQFISAHARTATTALDKGYGEISNQIMNLADAKMPKDMGGGSVLKYFNDRAGLRWQSSTDFKPKMTLDYIQTVINSDQIGLMGHVYTKEPDLVELLGNTGLKINMSLFGKRDAQGKIVDNGLGFNWKQAQKYREKFKDAGTIFVATDDDMARWAMKQPWIDMVIPFHSSGLSSERMEQLFGQGKFLDFTREQTVRKVVGQTKNGEPVMKAMKEHFKKGEHGNDPALARQLADERAKTGTMVPFYERYGKDKTLTDQEYFKVITDIARWDSPQTKLDASKINWVKAREMMQKVVAGSGEGMTEVAKPLVNSIVDAVESYGKTVEGKKNIKSIVESGTKRREQISFQSDVESDPRFEDELQKQLATYGRPEAKRRALREIGNKIKEERLQNKGD